MVQAGKGCRLGLWTTSGVAVGFMIFENCEEFLTKFQSVVFTLGKSMCIKYTSKHIMWEKKTYYVYVKMYTKCLLMCILKF